MPPIIEIVEDNKPAVKPGEVTHEGDMTDMPHDWSPRAPSPDAGRRAAALAERRAAAAAKNASGEREV